MHVTRARAAFCLAREAEVVTDQEWLQSDAPEQMPAWLRHSEKVSDRKLRLFAVACCRHVHYLIPDSRSWSALEAGERYADGVGNQADLARGAAIAGRRSRGDERTAASAVAFAASPYDELVGVAQGTARRAAAAVWRVAQAAVEQWDAERRWQCLALRDIFDNPFRPVALGPALRTPTVLSLAQRIYDNRHLPAGALDPMLLAALADVLEQTGCHNAGVLGHLRQPGAVHVRGCWVVDCLLEKK